MSSARFFVAACLPLLAIGIALARGKKQADAPVPVPPTVEAAPPAAPEVVAPPLFPSGLPVVVDSLPPGIASLSAQSCNACHWAAHDSWSESAHARAWSDPPFQAALAATANSTACLSCHLPVAAQHDRLAAAYTEGDISRPEWAANASFDASLMSEGVTCAACHVRGGVVLGTRTSAASPHPIVVSSELQSSELCATCHQLSWPGADQPHYNTYGEWSASPYATAKVTCRTCHMAPATGQSQPGVTDFVASHGAPLTIGRALTTIVSMPAASITRGQSIEIGVSVINSGAGHSVPTGNPAKAYTISVVLLDAAGKEMAPAHQTILQRTLEAGPPWRTTADTRIPPLENRSWKATFTPNAKATPGLGAVVVRAQRANATEELRRIPVQVK